MKVTCQYDEGFCSQCHRELSPNRVRRCQVVIPVIRQIPVTEICQFLGPLSGEHHKRCCNSKENLKEYFCLNPRRMFFSSKLNVWRFGRCTKESCQDSKLIQPCNWCQLRRTQLLLT